MDNTTIHPSCVNEAHRIDLHLWRGAPQNLDEDRPIQILVNQGFVVGYSSDRLQPAWSAYRVAHADDDVDYDRPLMYYDDMRLDDEYRIGRGTFGKIGGIQLNVGHMSSNEVINRQFGRLAQLETFLMSNMSPQYGSLNSGVWLQLENSIREIKDEPGKDHVWAIVGPVFGDSPPSISRGSGRNLPIPEKYFCIVVDPHRYPYNTLSRVKIDCYLIPQDAPSSSGPEDYPVSLAQIEALTNLKFFKAWGREIPDGAVSSTASGGEYQSRLSVILERRRQEREAEAVATANAAEMDSIEDMIDALGREASGLKNLRRSLTVQEMIRLEALQHTLSWLTRAQLLNETDDDEADTDSTVITYLVASDMDGKLQRGARTACNFWNRFIQPQDSVVIRLGVFTQNSYTIARAYKPYAADDGTRYGRVEFNTTYLADFSADQIAGTIIHEIGHTLGIGWDKWQGLYHHETGRFKSRAVRKLPALANMVVELDGGAGTALAHWDEHVFDKELMTGNQDTGEHVLPVTIDVMELFGHKVIESLNEETPLSDLLRDASRAVFSRQNEARALNLHYFVETEIMETIPHRLGDIS